MAACAMATVTSSWLTPLQPLIQLMPSLFASRLVWRLSTKVETFPDRFAIDRARRDGAFLRRLRCPLTPRNLGLYRSWWRVWWLILIVLDYATCVTSLPHPSSRTVKNKHDDSMTSKRFLYHWQDIRDLNKLLNKQLSCRWFGNQDNQVTSL